MSGRNIFTVWLENLVGLNLTDCSIWLCTVFLRSGAAATIYCAARFMRLLFKGGVYFFGKPGDIHDSWIG